MPVDRDPAEFPEDHLYVCEYEGRRTIARGTDVHYWNEGLEGEFAAVRDLGAVVHAWDVTDPGVGSVTRAVQYVTDEGYAITTGAEPGAEDARIERDVAVSVAIPTAPFEPKHLTAAAERADPATLSGDDRARLRDDAAGLAAAINAGVADRLRDRYETWRTAQFPYPRGRDGAYDVPLEHDWKRRVLSACEPLSEGQAAAIAAFGYPLSMRVEVDVD